MAAEIFLRRIGHEALEPGRLLASGYDFRFPDLERALGHLPGK